ncbi:PcfJ domain-containing protein [Pedobacter sp.]|uniref:PcfJ domain-containing protein n=1 Tax=Pedobacter sp. TaxID=1411316 RepID=UPI003D7F8CD5
MRPQSKRQVRVNDLSLRLPKLADKLEAWAFKNCIDHIGYRNKMWTNCLSCGQVWPTTSLRIKSEVCPGCNWKLCLETTQKQKSRQQARFAVLEVMEEFQVVRYFHIDCRMKSKQKPECYTREIMQHWILPNGEFEIMSVQVGGMGLSYDHFCSGEMSLKSKRDQWKYNIQVYKIYPEMDLQPEYMRNGFTSKVTSIIPFNLLRSLVNDTKAETLIKSKQMDLLRVHLGDRSSGSYRHWPSIKICIRTGYIVKDAITWLDYLDLLDWFGKDLRNAKYVCPKNLKDEHDRLVKKKTEIQKRQDIEKRMKQAESDQVEYAKAKAAFFGISFTDKDLEIKVLESVQEFIEEADTHKHCVYSNRYFTKEDSLVFSARVKGKPVETVEVSLSGMKILQSRGLQNKLTEYHDQIIELVNSNMQVIIKRVQQLKAA